MTTNAPTLDIKTFESVIFMGCRHSLVLLVVLTILCGFGQLLGLLTADVVKAILESLGILYAALLITGGLLVLRRQLGPCGNAMCLAVRRARSGRTERGFHVCHKHGMYYGKSLLKSCEHRNDGHCVFPKLSPQQN
jgi:hypothetical protein